PFVHFVVVLITDRPPHHLEQFLQPLDLVATDVLNGLLRGQAFQRAADIEGFFDVAFGQAGDERAAAGLDVNQPFAGELLYCLPDGGQADSEFSRQVIDLEPLPRLHRGAENGLPENIVNCVRRAVALDARDFHDWTLQYW